MGTATNQASSRPQTKPAQVKVSVDPQIATAFKEACAASNISMAAVLTRFMADYSNSMAKARDTPGYTTRRKRRAVIKRIIAELERLKAAEQYLVDNAPENLQDAPVYEAADEYISIFGDVIDQLGVMVP